MTSRRLNLHLESRGSLRDKNFGEFRSKTTFTFCENHKKLSNLPLSPHSILQNWVDYLKVTSLRDNPYYPKMPTGQSGRPCSVGHSYTRESTDKNSWVFPEGAFLWGSWRKGVNLRSGLNWGWNYSEGESLGTNVFETYQGIGLHANGHHGKWKIDLRSPGSHENHLPKIEF